MPWPKTQGLTSVEQNGMDLEMKTHLSDAKGDQEKKTSEFTWVRITLKRISYGVITKIFLFILFKTENVSIIIDRLLYIKFAKIQLK